MGMELAAAIVGLTLAGYWVDLHFQTQPRGLLVGAILGVVGGFYNFIREALQLSRLQHSFDQTRSKKPDDPDRRN
ncbi:MAG: AtpZ/AtpI family protein [Phycisphaerae bacterium]|nr:AtpZ/AtpI family protein [Phycisphaerae bacterium]